MHLSNQISKILIIFEIYACFHRSLQCHSHSNWDYSYRSKPLVVNKFQFFVCVSNLETPLGIDPLQTAMIAI